MQFLSAELDVEPSLSQLGERVVVVLLRHRGENLLGQIQAADAQENVNLDGLSLEIRVAIQYSERFLELILVDVHDGSNHLPDVMRLFVFLNFLLNGLDQIREFGFVLQKIGKEPDSN